MGRKPDPKGKDRTRTIQLAGDVADIAQKLADNGQLSATLSDLLRQQYGFGDKIEERKRALTMLLDEKQRLTELTQTMADEIDALETQALEQNATIRPALERRRQILLDRLAATHKKLQRCYSPQEESRLHAVSSEINQLIVAVDLELEALN